MRLPTVLRWALRLLILLLVVGVLVRPGWGTTTTQARLSDLEVLVAVDRTRSMAALDHPDGPRRIDGVRHDLRALAEELPGSRFAMVTFGGDVVRTAMPFSTDLTAFTALVDTVPLEGPFYGAGSMVDTPLQEITSRLEQAEQQHPGRKRILVFVTDGENTKKDAGEQASFAPLAGLVDGGVVMAYGTEEGGEIPVGDDDNDDVIVTEDGPAISRLDRANVERIAEQAGLQVDYRSEDPSSLSDLAESFGADYTDGADTTTAEREMTWVLGLLLLAAVLVELLLAARTLIHVRAGRRPQEGR